LCSYSQVCLFHLFILERGRGRSTQDNPSGFHDITPPGCGQADEGILLYQQDRRTPSVDLPDNL